MKAASRCVTHLIALLLRKEKRSVGAITSLKKGKTTTVLRCVICTTDDNISSRKDEISIHGSRSSWITWCCSLNLVDQWAAVYFMVWALLKSLTRSISKMLGPFATASRCTLPVLILHCHSPGFATVACKPAHRCPQRQQRERVIEGTAMAP